MCIKILEYGGKLNSFLFSRSKDRFKQSGSTGPHGLYGPGLRDLTGYGLYGPTGLTGRLRDYGPYGPYGPLRESEPSSSKVLPCSPLFSRGTVPLRLAPSASWTSYHQKILGMSSVLSWIWLGDSRKYGLSMRHRVDSFFIHSSVHIGDVYMYTCIDIWEIPGINVLYLIACLFPIWPYNKKQASISSAPRKPLPSWQNVLLFQKKKRRFVFYSKTNIQEGEGFAKSFGNASRTAPKSRDKSKNLGG